MHHEEQQLIERARRRDAKAFGTLYDLYFNKIFKYIHYKIKRKDEAEDLTAVVFLKAWEAIEKFRWQGYPFSTWLYRIAHNQLVDTYRTYRETVPLEVARGVDGDADPFETVERTSVLVQVRGALNHLTHEQQRVLTLRYFEGYSIGEIAALMDKAPDAVRALQHRALRGLEPCIEIEPDLRLKRRSRTAQATRAHAFGDPPRPATRAN